MDNKCELTTGQRVRSAAFTAANRRKRPMFRMSFLTLTALCAITFAVSTIATPADAGPKVKQKINIRPPKAKVRVNPVRPKIRVKINTKRLAPKKAPAKDAKKKLPSKITSEAAKVIPEPVARPNLLPETSTAAINPDNLKTIPSNLQDINSEDFQRLKDLQDFATNGPNNAAPDVFGVPHDGQDFATNGPNNAAPDVFGVPHDGQSGDEPPILNPSTDPSDANNQKNRDQQLEHFREIYGNDPNNPGGHDNRQGRDFHTPAKNPGAAGSVINDPRGRASGREADEGGYTRVWDWSDDNGEHTDIEAYRPDGEGGSTTYYTTIDETESGFRVQTDTKTVDSDGNAVVERGVAHTQLNPVEGNPDSQPGAEGSGPGGADNCGFNPMSGCTRKSTPIWKAAVQPGAHQDTDGGAAGPSLGQEAVTNTGDGTFDSGASRGGGGAGQPDPCLTAGGCGPITEGGANPAAVN